MSSISNDQKQLLLDYALGMASESESVEAQALISCNKEAAKLHEQFISALAPLSTVEPEPCPDWLAERTIHRLVEAANSGHEGLEELLATEQSRPVTIRVGFWRNLSEMVAVAAVIMLVAGILLPLLGHQRQQYWKDRCQAQLSSIFQGLSNYVKDHDGRAPVVTAQTGRQWNTQSLYLPLKLGYIKNPSLFLCPARKTNQTLELDLSRVAEYDDFPVRGYVTYSPRKQCPNSSSGDRLCRGPILSDRNPMFEDESFTTFKKRLDQAILRANSRNHGGKGQNILHDDGRVQFVTIRHIGAGDDMFALNEMCCGDEVDECEVLPASEHDVFMAP
ncbi:MAG: hypothetical protein JW720_01415 [Sedimentisphaerales bacterium]|nr:hypothetical protein [Sedimentisphaerales bacterium]